MVLGPLPISWSSLSESIPAKISPLGVALADEEVTIYRTADRICSPTDTEIRSIRFLAVVLVSQSARSARYWIFVAQ